MRKLLRRIACMVWHGHHYGDYTYNDRETGTVLPKSATRAQTCTQCGHQVLKWWEFV